MLKIYGNPLSTCTRKVLMTLAETSTPFEMTESRAMSRYINQKAGGQLVPSDLKAAAKVEQWISIETSEFSGHAMKFVYEYAFKRPQEASVLEGARKTLETTCSVMDRQLAQTPFVAGATFSLADI